MNIKEIFSKATFIDSAVEFYNSLNLPIQLFDTKAIKKEDYFGAGYHANNTDLKLVESIFVVGVIQDEALSQENKNSFLIEANKLAYDYIVLVAVTLKHNCKPTRTLLSNLTRLLNKPFNTNQQGNPVAIVFRYNDHLSFAHTQRVTYAQAFRAGEKLTKVTLLKDININQPHAAHKRILDKLAEKQHKTVADLYNYWQTVFNTKELGKEFYKEIFNWYEWAQTPELNITFPNNVATPEDDRYIQEHLIRLITRVLFVWFIRQKNLVPESIFEIEKLNEIIKDFKPQSKKHHNYYWAILQNLFFATLNNKIEDRAFALDGNQAQNKEHYGVKNLFRYTDEFVINQEAVIQLFSKIPYLNGGLFECLDKDTPDSKGKIIYSDGFSRNPKTSARAFIPNIVFFDPQKGLFSILNRYYFTVEENTPDEETIALDPELLGKVFENLLGTYNPETRETARKQSGSFYTPKEIVEYMANTSLIQYLKTTVDDSQEEEYKKLFEPHATLENVELNYKIYDALKACKILDPACGSGAYPMGVLHQMVLALQKVLPPNKKNKNWLYDLKLHLIENCIYGIDIQCIAVQISKLRFFISLICEQEPNDNAAENYGMKELPNLETKFVTANTLIGLKEKKIQLNLFEDPQIGVLKKEIESIRHQHFGSKSYKEKKSLRDADKKKREALLNLLNKDNAFDNQDAEQIANWNPYDQTTSAPFFDKEWMFGLKEGFDVVIGNPPYVSTKGVSDADKIKLKVAFGFADDLYYHFIIKGFDLLKQNGINCMITPDTYFTTLTKQNLRKKIIDNKLVALIHLGHDVFECAMVSTAIFVVQKNTNNQTDNIIQIIDSRGKKVLKEAHNYKDKQSLYSNSINGSFFMPTEANLAIHKKLASVHQQLLKDHWTLIATSREIEKNKIKLDKYRNNLKVGDITLVGLVTEGGQGLATANNGKFVGVKYGTKEANRIVETRIEKLKAANESLGTDYKMPNDETAIWDLFEKIKTKHGRDIFGQGYLYKIVSENLIADVNNLTSKEKENGIKGSASFVPYDKGDKDGNRWYLPTPYYIDWSVANVKFLKENSGKKGSGMPVIRNPQFYFREGFCWIDVNSTYLKCRLKQKSVHDVISMSLFSTSQLIPEYYFITIINSSIISELVQCFINNTSHFQINDCRSLPIPVPSSMQLAKCKDLFDKAFQLQEDFFNGKIVLDKKEKELEKVQKEVDKFVTNLYDLDEDFLVVGYTEDELD
jgi:hypothetical protein